MLAGSTSPDGRLCFIEGFRGPFTANAIVLASTDRKRVLADAPLVIAYSTDRPHKGRITIVWSADSTRVALHDSISKHSVLTMLRAVGDAFEPVVIPNLLQAACQHWRIDRATVASSGQRPLGWSDDILSVEVTARFKSAAPRAIALQINAPKEGAPTVRPN